jgi:predicted anti-sigma-YlaC factor YlaD
MKQASSKDIFTEMQRTNRMDCAQFRELLHELGRPESEGAMPCEQALAHAETCSACETLLTEVESLDFSLREIVEETSELQAPPRLETLLLQEFRREKSAATSRRVRWQLAAIGVAAAIFLALGLTLHRQQPVTPGGTASTGLASTQTPNEQPATKTSDGNAQAGESTAQTAANAAQAAGSAESEYATAYMPLPYAYDPSELEGGAVVRVMLPRAALASYGLPVEGMGVTDQVTADMVVSQDGTPQAIRLVAQSDTNTDSDF